ncbi:hypothetical protein HNR30_001402 [Nonomuraea soli]|uniref:Uncharacterized protein n=1 Tax=Nonomuraea soli TaxID=1032476 RepID=A0A7W0CF72_9ACTN|nr:hypothetical protein [Nonomuraea soli]
MKNRLQESKWGGGRYDGTQLLTTATLDSELRSGHCRGELYPHIGTGLPFQDHDLMTQSENIGILVAITHRQ